MDTTANILELSLSIHQQKKGQKQYNQIKEMSKAPDVNGGGGETQSTFPLYILGKEKVFKTSWNVSEGQHSSEAQENLTRNT